MSLRGDEPRRKPPRHAGQFVLDLFFHETLRPWVLGGVAVLVGVVVILIVVIDVIQPR